MSKNKRSRFKELARINLYFPYSAGNLAGHLRCVLVIAVHEESTDVGIFRLQNEDDKIDGWNSLVRLTSSEASLLAKTITEVLTKNWEGALDVIGGR